MAEVTKAASVGELGLLHKLLAKSFKERLEADMQDNIPTDAATLGALAKFLKDNSVTADPASADDLGVLRAKLQEQSAARRARVGNVISLAGSDLLAKEA